MNPAITLRTARKDHRCQRANDEGKLGLGNVAHGACLHGGTIRAWGNYVETEGEDPFHPDRYHPDCFEATVRESKS